MALPSAVSIGSLALVVAAGVGLVAVTTGAGDETPRQDAPSSNARPHRHHEATADKGHQQSPASRQDAHDAVPKVLVELYNNTGVVGMASKYSKELQAAGWNVAATDNWYGVIPDNTVYYPANLRGAAEKLADALDIDRLRPAVSPMRFDRLTVIFSLPA